MLAAAGAGHAHDLHAVLVSAMCLLSMAHAIPEIAVLHFSTSYFLADTLESVMAKKFDMVVAHHLPSLALFGAQPLFPQMLSLRYGSRLLIIEVSTPLLTRWRRSKRKDHFQQFMAVFFLMRVVYLSSLFVSFREDVSGWVGLSPPPHPPPSSSREIALSLRRPM